MNPKVRDKLIEVAKLKQTKNGLITYSELDYICNLKLDFSLERDRAEIGRILGEIFEYEVEAGRPILTAVVVHNARPYGPGPGFFKLARKLGIHTGESDDIFWAKELKKTIDYWSKHDA